MIPGFCPQLIFHIVPENGFPDETFRQPALRKQLVGRRGPDRLLFPRKTRDKRQDPLPGSLKNIALQREKTLQEILDEAISFYLKKEK